MSEIKHHWKSWLVVIACGWLSACSGQDPQTESKVQLQAQADDVLAYVDPLIGTGGHGHTFPGATVPFGMVQLSPDNPSGGWDWTSGYHYSDNVLLGFSHTHLSGTGVGDLLDILMLPMSGRYPQNANNTHKRPFATYSHDHETATAGYYALELPEQKIKAELTASARVGVHRYHFSAQEPAQILIDLGYAQNYDKAEDTWFKVESDRRIVGYRKSKGWAEHQPVYFVIEFNHPFDHKFYREQQAEQGDEIQGVKTEAVLTFPRLKDQALVAKVGISYASVDGARGNIALEVPHFDFDQVKSEAENLWRNQLEKITVKDNDKVEKTKFYTALYHSFMAPHLFSDANGEYYGADGKTHKAEGYQRYTLFSLWDTFRALHPLLTITNPDMVDDLVRSMMAFYDEKGLLPSWDLMSNETDVMIGYHAIPVLVDAWAKGLTDVDPELIFTAMKKSAMQDRFGIDLFAEYGYVPSDLEVEAVSKTLEYAYDDWAIASMAKALGKDDEYAYFTQRAQAYKTLFDSQTGFMRGKDQHGQWVTPFSPTHVEHRKTDYTEANAWQYTWFVPHDVSGLIQLFGGEDPFVTKLDELFTVSSAMEGDVSPDISGLIGQYAHGNEPCHHIPYLYGFTDQKWKGEARIRQIRQTMYHAAPDGLAGNDDVGQMSAWYVFSAMGFYPVNPADGRYILGTPLFDEVKIVAGNGKIFEITKQGDTGANFIKHSQLNQTLMTRPYIEHQDMVNGGQLHYVFE